MNVKRDNIRAGMFVITGVVLALVVVFLLTDFRNLVRGTQEVKAYYQLSDGVSGLQEGAQVTLGDEPIGTVERIEDVVATDGSERVVGKVVVFRIPRDQPKLYWNAELEIKAPPIGSGAKLNIRSVGSGAPYSKDTKIPAEALRDMGFGNRLTKAILERIPPGAIPGQLAHSPITRDFARDLGIGDEQRGQIREIIANVQNISDALGSRKESMQQIVGDVEQITQTLREELPNLKQTIADLKQATAEAKEILAATNQRKDKWFDDTDQITGNLRDSTARIDKLLADKDPKLREVVDNVQAISAAFKDETLAEVNKTLESAREGAKSFREAADRVGGLIASQSPVLERTIANLQLTSAQLKMTSLEVRRSPWRLLYQPSDQELETDNLYDAARSFAIAAGALQASAQSLNAYATARPDDEPTIRAKLEHLEELFKRYKEAEDRFWQRLGEMDG